MDIEKLTQSDTQDFILGNKSVDIKKLALEKMPYEGDLRQQILQQIKSHQKAKNKLEQWTNRKGIIFPNPDLVEQSSSDITAEYKPNICPQEDIHNKTFIDMTSGLGSDSHAFLKRFKSGTCIEAEKNYAALLEYNLKILSQKSVTVINSYAKNIIDKLPKTDLIYIDPERRNQGQNKRGIYGFSDMSPNILDLLPKLKELAPWILIKTSPFLDIDEAIKQLEAVQEVHVLEHDKQCKEVLYFINQNAPIDDTKIIAVQLDTDKTYDILKSKKCKYGSYDTPKKYLYEPCVSLLKSDLHQNYAQEMNLAKISHDTHLYTSDEARTSFMGRSFKIIDILPVKKKDIYKALPDKQANITVRGFPLSVENLRKKFDLKDGGDKTLFGCTFHTGEKRLILCEPS